MKKFFYLFAILIILTVAVFAQTAISDLDPTPSPQPTPEIKADLLAIKTSVEKAEETAAYELQGFANAAQSENKLSYSGDRLRLLQPSYTPLNGAKSFFTIGANNRRVWPTALNLTASEISLPLTISGTNKSYYGQNIDLDLQGTVSNPNIIGSRVAIFSNSFTGGGTGNMIGYASSVDVGGPVNFATGANFTAATGSVGAVGTVTLSGINVLTSIHNAGATNMYGGDFWLASSPSTPAATATNAYVLRLRARVNNAVTFTNLRFISLAESSLSGTGAVTTSYGIYADSTIDLGTTRYFIFSTSTSPSRFAGDVRISDTTKGIILTSPDGSCYRFTVADGGALSAGALVTCQ